MNTLLSCKRETVLIYCMDIVLILYQWKTFIIIRRQFEQVFLSASESDACEVFQLQLVLLRF